MQLSRLLVAGIVVSPFFTACTSLYETVMAEPRPPTHSVQVVHETRTVSVPVEVPVYVPVAANDDWTRKKPVYDYKIVKPAEPAEAADVEYSDKYKHYKKVEADEEKVAEDYGKKRYDTKDEETDSSDKEDEGSDKKK